MCCCECCKSSKVINSSLFTWRDRRLKNLNDKSNNAQNRDSGEISSRIFETYKGTVQPHGCHIYNTDVEMVMATMFTCTSKNHGLPHWKCVSHFCDNFRSIVLPIQEENKDTTNTRPTIRFYIYHNVSRCTLQSRRP